MKTETQPLINAVLLLYGYYYNNNKNKETA